MARGVAGADGGARGRARRRIVLRSEDVRTRVSNVVVGDAASTRSWSSSRVGFGCRRSRRAVPIVPRGERDGARVRDVGRRRARVENARRRVDAGESARRAHAARAVRVVVRSFQGERLRGGGARFLGRTRGVARRRRARRGARRGARRTRRTRSRRGRIRSPARRNQDARGGGETIENHR